MNIEHLRKLYKVYAASRHPADRSACPSPHQLVRSFEPSFSRRSQKRIVDHISECSYCREEFMLLLEKRRSEDSSAEKDSLGPTDDRGRRFQMNIRGLNGSLAWRWVAVVAGIGLALSSYFTVIRQRNPSAVQRANESRIIQLAPRSGQAMTGPLLFQWERNSKVDYYVLEMFDDRMMPVWASSRIREARLTLPTEVRAGLIPGRTYYWMVTGFTQDSLKLESGLAKFQLHR